MTVTPIFLLSLPRSGSTLVQRVLACHPEIATTSEPWILLPLISTYADTQVYTEYVHHTAKAAIADFAATLPGGSDQYRRELRAFAIRLYEGQTRGDCRYFLDKTPRYHLIVRDVLELFPEGKFIFLWRNPLAIASSMIQSYSDGRWSVYRFKVDLYKGLTNLVDTYDEVRESVFAVNYENLVSGREAPWRQLFDYLDLPFMPSVLSDFAGVELRGRMKDFTGIERHKEITDANVGKWIETFRNVIRKRWARSYLKYLGEKRLTSMGYDLSSIEADLRAARGSVRSLVSDLAHEAFGLVYVWTEPGILRGKLKKLPDAKAVLKHG